MTISADLAGSFGDPYTEYTSLERRMSSGLSMNLMAARLDWVCVLCPPKRIEMEDSCKWTKTRLLNGFLSLYYQYILIPIFFLSLRLKLDLRMWNEELTFGMVFYNKSLKKMKVLFKLNYWAALKSTAGGSEVSFRLFWGYLIPLT